jgi:hypothetical protein
MTSQELRKLLHVQDNTQQLLTVINENYDLTENLNIFQKTILIEGLVKAIETLKPRPKKNG